MQVSEVGTRGSFERVGAELPSEPRVARGAVQREALGWLAEFVRLLRPDGRAWAAREAEQAEQRKEAQRRKDTLQEQARAAVAAAPRPSDVIFHAERNMLPGSHTARQEQLRELGQQHASTVRSPGRQQLASSSSISEVRPPASASPARAAATAEQPSETRAAQNTRLLEARAANADESRRPDSVPSAASLLVTARSERGMMFGPLAANGPAIAVTQLAAGRQHTINNASLWAGGKGGGSPSRPTGSVVGATVEAAAGRPAARSVAVSRTLAPAASNSEANIERILRLIRTQIGAQRSTATLRLEPPELGSIRLRMDLRGDRLTLEVQTETSAAQRLLSEQLDALRRSLEAGGIQLERVEIRAPLNLTEARGADTSAQNDVPAGRHEAGAQQDGAGGGSAGETDFPVEQAAAEPPSGPSGSADGWRVNVLA